MKEESWSPVYYPTTLLCILFIHKHTHRRWKVINDGQLACFQTLIRSYKQDKTVRFICPRGTGRTALPLERFCRFGHVIAAEFQRHYRRKTRSGRLIYLTHRVALSQLRGAYRQTQRKLFACCIQNVIENNFPYFQNVCTLSAATIYGVQR